MIWNKHAKPLSWSAISSFKYDHEQWYKKYVLGEKQKVSPQMTFGNTVGESLATDNPMVKKIVRYKHMEYKLLVPFNDIELVGFIDSYDNEKKLLREYKTSSSTKKWNQASVDDHGQLTMYALMLFIQDKVVPETLTIHLDYIPVEETFEGEMIISRPHTINTYKTQRTTKDILEFGASIKQVVKEMEEYAINHE